MSIAPVEGAARATPLNLPAFPERPGAPRRIATPPVAGTPAPAGGPSFADLLRDVASADRSAERAAQDYALGRNPDLQQTMLALEQARIKFALLVSVRNKLLDAYREVMRMS